MKERKLCPKNLFECVEEFSFPALVTDGAGEILHRNRAARGLLPPPWRLRRFLSGLKEKDSLFSATLDGISCFVGRKQEGEYSLYVFFETFLPFHPTFSRYLLKESKKHFQTFYDATRALGKQKDGERVPGERFIAGTEKLRRESAAFYRLLTAREYASGEKAVCDLPSLLFSVKDQLKKARVEMELSCPEKMGAEFSPSVLIFAILNIIQFVCLFEGKDRVRAELEKRGSKAALTIVFPDREGIFSALIRLSDGEENASLFPRAMGFAPLFSAMVVCDRENVRLRVYREEEEGKVELLLPCAAALPEAFLGTEDSKFILLVKEMIREFFSTEENI